MCGTANYEELDGPINGETAPTGCGDTTSGDPKPGTTSIFGAGTQAATLEVDNVTCPAAGSTCPAGSGITGSFLQLPGCSGWFQPAHGIPPFPHPTPPCGPHRLPPHP